MHTIARPVRVVLWGLAGVLGLATVLSIMAATADKPGDPYKLECSSAERSHSTLDYENDKTSVYDTPEAAIEASDLPKYIDVPTEAWKVVDAQTSPQNGISEDAEVNKGTEGTESGVRNFLVYVDGAAKVDLQLEPVESGYRLSGWVGC